MYDLIKTKSGVYHTKDSRYAVLREGQKWTVYTIDEWRYLTTGYSFDSLKDAVERYIKVH